MSDTAERRSASQDFAQKRRWLKTAFKLAPKKLHYRIESKNDVNLDRAFAWDTIAWRPSYMTTTEPDRELRWVAFVMTALAAFATFRGGPQPLTFLLYGGVTAVLLLGLAVTAKLRRVGYTAIPAGDVNILVLADDKHDRIVSAIESMRAGALMKLADPAPDITIRTYLRRLRWLSESGVMDSDDYLSRQRLALPDDVALAVAKAPVEREPVHIRQRRFGTTIDVTLLADRLTYRRSTLFGSDESFTMFYRDMSEQRALSGTDHQVELAGICFAWAALAVWAVILPSTQGHPPDYYVGGTGLKRALADYGPPLLAMAFFAWAIPAAFRLRYIEPWPGLRVLRGKTGDEIVAAIEQRRIAALRALAIPDPLLGFADQVELLDSLLENELISEPDYDRAVKQAAFVCDNPALDQPLMPWAQNAPERALH